MGTNRFGFWRAVTVLLAIVASRSNALTLLWDTRPDWPPGTTVEACVNDDCIAGIVAGWRTFAAAPGDVISARARASAPDGRVSDWATLSATNPPAPAGFWAARESVTMADPVYQGSGTLSALGWTIASSISTTITNVAVGDLLLVQVQRDQQSQITGVASASPSLTFTLAKRADSNSNGFSQDIWAAIATTAAASMTITASYSSAAAWGSIISHRWSGGVTSATPTHTSGHTALQSTSTNRTVLDVTTTARTLILAFGSDWDYYRTHTAAANWTKILDSQTKGTDSTTMFLHARIADAGTYPSGNFATASATDQYFAGIVAFAVDTGGGPVSLAATAQSRAAATGGITMAMPVVAASAVVQTTTGSMAMAVPVQATASTLAASSGQILMTMALSGAALAQASASAGLGMATPLQGAGVAQASASGALQPPSGGLEGTAAVSATGTGALSVLVTLAGSAVAQALTQAGVTVQTALAAAAAARAAATGGAAQTTPLQGAAAATATGTGGVAQAIPLQGAVTVNVTATGDLQALGAGALAGSAAAQAGATGNVGMALPITGFAQAVSAATGALGMAVPVQGSATATVAASGNLQITLGVVMSADAMAQAVANGQLVLTAPLSALALAQAAASGALSGGVDSYTASPGRAWRAAGHSRSWKL